ncbi:MAG: isoprenylcysteine carboxylmethyltransferase family protein, partial [Candidatus Omnitrophota bacterium]
MKQRIKINGVVIIIGVAVIAFFPDRIIRHSSFFLDDVLEVIGVSLILLGQLLRVSARGHKAENSLGGNHLIQDGPYSVVRNPMYLGIILIGLGTVLFILEFWVAVVFAALFISRYLQLFVKEEKILLKSFGQEYAAYKKNVPRLFPSLSFIFKKEMHSWLPLKLAWFKREFPSIAVVLGVCLAIEFREAVKSNGLSALIPEAFILLTVAIFYFIFILFLLGHNEKKAK